MLRLGSPYRTAFIWTSLFFATLNAISYFVLSDAGGDLLGVQVGRVEAIGFPMIVWQEDVDLYPRPIAVCFNICLAMICSVLIGTAARVYAPAPKNPRVVDADNQRTPSIAPRWRWTIADTLIITLSVAVCMAVFTAPASQLDWWLTLLMFGTPSAILLAGVWLRNVRPRVRYGLLTIVSVSLVACTLWAGTATDAQGDFAMVLLRAIVCWVPLCVFQSLGLAAAANLWDTRIEPRLRLVDDAS